MLHPRGYFLPELAALVGIGKNVEEGKNSRQVTQKAGRRVLMADNFSANRKPPNLSCGATRALPAAKPSREPGTEALHSTPWDMSKSTEANVDLHTQGSNFQIRCAENQRLTLVEALPKSACFRLNCSKTLGSKRETSNL